MALAIEIPIPVRRARTRLELFLLPIGFGVLTPDAALEWLESVHHLYARLVTRGFRSDEKRDRDAAEWLLMDLAHMSEACGRALAKGKPVRLERTGGPDFEDATRDLGRILALVDAEYPDAVDCEIREHLFGALARELALRIGILIKRRG